MIGVARELWSPYATQNEGRSWLLSPDHWPGGTNKAMQRAFSFAPIHHVPVAVPHLSCGNSTHLCQVAIDPLLTRFIILLGGNAVLSHIDGNAQL